MHVNTRFQLRLCARYRFTSSLNYFRSDMGWHHQSHDLGHREVWTAIHRTHKSSEYVCMHAWNILSCISVDWQIFFRWP